MVSLIWSTTTFVNSVRTILTPLVPPAPAAPCLQLRSFVVRSGFVWHQHKRRNDGVASVSCVNFDAFLRKNLGDSRAFTDSIWSRVKINSQYQTEEVQDWAAHLEHFQAILIEFDADGAAEESDLI